MLMQSARRARRFHLEDDGSLVSQASVARSTTRTLPHEPRSATSTTGPGAPPARQQLAAHTASNHLAHSSRACLHHNSRPSDNQEEHSRCTSFSGVAVGDRLPCLIHEDELAWAKIQGENDAQQDARSQSSLSGPQPPVPFINDSEMEADTVFSEISGPSAEEGRRAHTVSNSPRQDTSVLAPIDEQEVTPGISAVARVRGTGTRRNSRNMNLPGAYAVRGPDAQTREDYDSWQDDSVVPSHATVLSMVPSLLPVFEAELVVDNNDQTNGRTDNDRRMMASSIDASVRRLMEMGTVSSADIAAQVQAEIHQIQAENGNLAASAPPFIIGNSSARRSLRDVEEQLSSTRNAEPIVTPQVEPTVEDGNEQAPIMASSPPPSTRCCNKKKALIGCAVCCFSLVVVIIAAVVVVELNAPVPEIPAAPPIPPLTETPSYSPSFAPSLVPTSSPAPTREPFIGTWEQSGQDLVGDVSFDRFGSAVAVSGDGSIMAVGAPRYAPLSFVDPGYVRVYRLFQNGTSSEWVQLGSDIESDALADEFGYSIALSENGLIIVIGAWFSEVNDAKEKSGLVQVYAYGDGEDWVQVGQDIVGDEPFDRLGASVALSADGQIWAAGAPTGLNDLATRSGIVVVYRYDMPSSIWVQMGQTLQGVANEDGFGTAVSLSSAGDVLAIGGPGHEGNQTNAGHVRVYHFNETSAPQWVQKGPDIDGEITYTFNKFGTSVSLTSDGNMFAAGAIDNSENGTENAGHVQVWKYDPLLLNWTQVGGDINGDGSGDGLGYSVSISSDGNLLAAGAWGSSRRGEQNGTGPLGNEYVRVYQYEPTFSWTQVGETLRGANPGDEFGWSVALTNNGTQVLCGARLHNPSGFENGTQSGHAKFYTLNFN